MAFPNTNVNELTAITNTHFMDDVAELVFDQDVYFATMWKNRRTAPGGTKIVQPILYQYSQEGFYTPGQKMNTAGEDQVTRAEFNWKFCREKVVIDEEDIDKNSGPEAIFNLLDTKMMGAKLSIRDKISTEHFTASNGDSSTAVNSLENLLGDDTNPSGNLTSGGIDKSAQAFWRGKGKDFTTGVLGTVADMNDLWFDIADGAMVPDIIISNNGPLKNYINERQGTGGALDGVATAEHFVNTETLRGGFTGVFYQGARWMTDRRVPDYTGSNTGRLFMVNSKFVHLVVHSKRQFELKPFKMPEDQYTMVASIKCMLNFTVSEPKRSGVMYT